MNHLITGYDYFKQKHESLGIIITGDFNRADVRNLKCSFCLEQLVKAPTRKNAILDLFLTNMPDMYSKVEVLPPIATSDHNVILASPIFTQSSLEPTFKVKRCQSHTNKVSFVNALCLINWNFVFLANTCQRNFRYFITF